MPFDSLFTGVSGLNAYQNEIDIISNNIANVGTVGYKGQNVTFQDLLYQTQQYASAPNGTRGGINAQQVGYGVKTGTVDTDFSQGGLQTTGINTDLAINGDGFFVLNNKTGTGSPTYTRDGHFSLNQDGLLYDPSSGLAVMGYAINSAGNVVIGGTPGPLQIPLGLKSQATGTGFGAKLGPVNAKQFDVSFGGNLDQTKFIQAAQTNSVVNLTTISTTIYDSLGNGHLVNITFAPAASVGNQPSGLYAASVQNTAGVTTAVGTEWQYTVTSTDGTAISAPSGFVFFDNNGQFINTAGNATGTQLYSTAAGPSTGTGSLIQITGWGAGTTLGTVTTSGNNAALTSTAPLPAIGIDFSNMSSLAGASTVNTVAQNGYTQGTLSNITIGGDGTINGAFTNGQSKVLGQVALATFQNEQGLTRVGNSMFAASPNSGLAQLGVGQSGRFGNIVAGSLEQSNVSIADQFTKMISAQRAFEANSRSITTADQDLQTVIGLKR